MDIFGVGIIELFSLKHLIIDHEKGLRTKFGGICVIQWKSYTSEKSKLKNTVIVQVYMPTINHDGDEIEQV